MFFNDFTDLNEKNLLSLEYEIQTAIKSKSFPRAVSRFLFAKICFNDSLVFVVGKFADHFESSLH